MIKFRKCLDCGISFESINSGNRICPRCKSRHDKLESASYGDYVYFGMWDEDSPTPITQVPQLASPSA